MSSIAAREPFKPLPGSENCPDLSGELEELVEAELPEFCKIENLVRVVTAIPGEPEKPTIPTTETKCPCPESSSQYISFESSEDCCDWTIDFDEPAVYHDVVCPIKFTMCVCKKRYENNKYCDRYCCCDSTCQDMYPGEMRLISGSYQYKTSDGKTLVCRSYILVYKPPQMSMGKCVTTVEGFKCKADGAFEDERDIKISCPGKICIQCGGSSKACAEANPVMTVHYVKEEYEAALKSSYEFEHYKCCYRLWRFTDGTHKVLLYEDVAGATENPREPGMSRVRKADLKIEDPEEGYGKAVYFNLHACDKQDCETVKIEPDDEKQNLVEFVYEPCEEEHEE